MSQYKYDEDFVNELTKAMKEKDEVINDLRTSVLSLNGCFRKVLESNAQGFVLDGDMLAMIAFLTGEARKTVIGSFGRKNPSPGDETVN